MVIALAEKHKEAYNVACDNITRSKYEEATLVQYQPGQLVYWKQNTMQSCER
jgi:hypothetical protein